LVFDLSELLGGVGVAQNIVKFLKVLLKDIFDTGKLVTITRSLLGKLLDVFDVTLMPGLRMTAKVEGTVLKPLFISSNFIPMLLF